MKGKGRALFRASGGLQQCAEDNWQVCNCATLHNISMPCVARCIVTSVNVCPHAPKSLLRHKQAVSDVSAFVGDSSFHRFLWDDGKDRIHSGKKIKRVVICSGKVYYDLLKERDERGIKDVYLLRLEQLYPFPDSDLGEELAQFPEAEIVWCQEEPKNMGSWTLSMSVPMLISKHKRARYVGRPARHHRQLDSIPPC